jgi:uncharacterized protein with HEPN domain
VPSKDPVQRFEDILDNISLIEQFTDGFDATSFAQDPKTSNAAERCLERISEAARKLGAVAEDLCPEIAWPRLRAVGNLLRHEYDRIEIGRVWLMIERDLPSLKLAVQTALGRLRDRGE